MLNIPNTHTRCCVWPSLIGERTLLTSLPTQTPGGHRGSGMCLHPLRISVFPGEHNPGGPSLLPAPRPQLLDVSRLYLTSGRALKRLINGTKLAKRSELVSAAGGTRCFLHVYFRVRFKNVSGDRALSCFSRYINFLLVLPKSEALLNQISTLLYQ